MSECGYDDHAQLSYSTALDWIEQGLTSHQTHHRSYWGRGFMGQMTQPTVSKH